MTLRSNNEARAIHIVLALIVLTVLMYGAVQMQACSERRLADDQADCRARGGRVITKHTTPGSREAWSCLEP